MGIDGIGSKGPPVPPVADGGGAARSGAAGPTFSIQRPAATTAAPSSQAAQGADATTKAAAPRTALERLRAGDIDIKHYVDLKVDEATRHLTSLSPSALDGIRASLRERLAHDPGLADLVRAATGQAAPPVDD